VPAVLIAILRRLLIVDPVDTYFHLYLEFERIRPHLRLISDPTAAHRTEDHLPRVAAMHQEDTIATVATADQIHRGVPGYSSKLDRDGDGIACE